MGRVCLREVSVSGGSTVGTFKTEYRTYKIDYEYDFGISNHPRSRTLVSRCCCPAEKEALACALSLKSHTRT